MIKPFPAAALLPSIHFARNFLLAAVLLATATMFGCTDPPARNATAENTVPAMRGTTNTSSEQTPRVVVVGAGISGLSAALELGRGGADVTVIDISSVFGGHAIMSQGALSIVDTPMQRDAGIADSAGLAFQDFVQWGEGSDQQWVRYYVDHSCEDIYDWLLELGVKFIDVVPTPGNSVDRNHLPAYRGVGLVTPIYRACLELDNVHFVWNTRAENLIVDEQRVVGVETLDLRNNTSARMRVDSVVLATGGFQNNLQMVREFWPREFKFPQRILEGSGRHSTGLGHRMVQKAGGELVKMDYQWNYFTGIPDPRMPGTNRGLSAQNMHGLLVNSEGKRFANLHGWAKQVMPPLLAMDQVTCWFIFDEAIRSKTDVSGSDWANFEMVDRWVLQDPMLVKSADTIEELAELAGLPADNLAETLQRYHQLIEQGVDTDFGRFGPGKSEFNNTASPKLVTPPFYAMQTYPLTRKSMGGVAIDMGCRVVDKQQNPIPGLYAVGELTGLALINGNASLEGTFLGPCVVTGRVAARSILKQFASQLQVAIGDNRQCSACHHLAARIANSRSGYWHFEQVHATVLKKDFDCSECHGEVTPYRKEQHEIDPQVLTETCKRCHTGRE